MTVLTRGGKMKRRLWDDHDPQMALPSTPTVPGTRLLRLRRIRRAGRTVNPVRVNKKAKPTPRRLRWVLPSVPGTGHVDSAKSMEDENGSWWIFREMPLDPPKPRRKSNGNCSVRTSVRPTHEVNQQQRASPPRDW